MTVSVDIILQIYTKIVAYVKFKLICINMKCTYICVSMV